MARAYVRVCIDPGFEKKIKEDLTQMAEVISAELTAGEQDMIVIVEGESYEKILDFVIKKIRKKAGVKITWTNFVVEMEE
ncbi:MAG: Lrp/AsnC ligand binding domain-containing protein [Acidobacteriota bacterium]|nr:Lrp/AsnC family transcriptional regulator [Thermoanaerobaculaceae bacterium]